MSFIHAGNLIGVSTNRLLRMFDERKVPVSKVLPRPIIIDEFKGKRQPHIIFRNEFIVYK
jgi:hypothetical protein